MRRPRRSLLLGLVLAALGALLGTGCGPEAPPVDGLPETVDFNRHVKPILSDRCFACHGPDANTREADLRLDTPEGALEALTSGGNHAFVAGSLRRSEAFARMVSDAPDRQMPPPESNLSLTDYEVALIARWIEQGAGYEPHWSFIPAEAPAPPTLDAEGEAWARGAIDRFVGRRLAREDLRPGPPAAKEVLLRRVSFDLTGLPPSLDDLDAFLADDRPGAYERAVDRLLASPHYGERMAVEWLDAARYADSHGYQDDGLRTMWPWRDWVIEAYNENLPYDAFVRWQLAGDLLPDPTHEQVLATGFNRNHMQSQEGGIVLEEYRVEYVADRVQTLGAAFLGLTTECARCHDHKYDPISQEDYFRLFGFFNNVNEIGNIPYAGEASPTLTVMTDEAREALAPIQAEIRAQEPAVAVDAEVYDGGFEQWLGRVADGGMAEPAGLVGHFPLDGFEGDFKLANRARPAQPGRYSGDRDHPPVPVDGRIDGALALTGDGWLDTDEAYTFDRNEPFSLALWVHVADTAALEPSLIFGKTGGLFNGMRGYFVELEEDGTLSANLVHVAPDNAIEVVSRERLPTGRWVHLAMTYDGSSRAEGLRLYLDGEPMETRVAADRLNKSLLYTPHVVTGEPTNWGGNAGLGIGNSGNNRPRLAGTYVDDFRIYDRRLSGLEVRAVAGRAPDLGALADQAAGGQASAEAAMREHYVVAVDPGFRQRMEALGELRGQENETLTGLREVMVMQDRRLDRRPTYVLDRGAYDAPTTPVEPGTPESILAFPDSLPPNRLGLAEWLLHPEHPLFARVAVNRLWQQFFGRGLVKTSEDLGNQGDLPTHPDLLDYLATRYRALGWDTKALVKEIVTSATYRQASEATPELLERDPENALLARGPRFRLSAEMVRDNALAVSDLLVRRVGGPSVYPYQPPGLWKQLATRNQTEYQQQHGEALYRRSMYTIWKRTSPPPMMSSFDAAERNVCIVRRQRTNTPLQSLVLMNDPQFVEAARVLAERIMREGGADAQERLRYAFRLTTSRAPDADEMEVLHELLDAESAHFEDHAEEAEGLLAVGEWPRDPGLDPTEVAAYAVVANTLLNYDAAVFRR